MSRLILILAMFVSSLSFAADEGDLSVGLSMGENAMIGDSADAFGRNGLGFGGYVMFSPSDLFDLDINVLYSSHKNSGNTLGNIYGTMALRFGMDIDQLFPYISGGVGFYRSSVELAGIDGASTNFGMNIGGGLDVEIGSSFVIGVLMRYHPIFSSNDMFDVMMRIGFMFQTGVQGGWD